MTIKSKKKGIKTRKGKLLRVQRASEKRTKGAQNYELPVVSDGGQQRDAQNYEQDLVPDGVQSSEVCSWLCSLSSKLPI